MLDQKTAIVTGGSKGTGSAIVKKFCAIGYKVVFGARHDNGLEETLKGKARFVSMDVRTPVGHNALVRAALEWTGRLDVYVNNAGVSIWKPVQDINEEFLDLLIDTNLKGLFWGCQAAARQFLVAGNGGCIINISSLAGKRGSANNSAYCASKFGVNGITQSLAKELGKSSIRVNAVCPVYIVTESLKTSLTEAVSPTGGANVKEFLDGFAKKDSALGRLPLAEEVADVCAYLASDQASAITAQCINVDCGVMPS